ncbi:MAG: glycerol-3-phosphate acyltransferase [bacterium]|nr:glycerol-3-phosphate acyltransferase [bacterium]
MTELILTFALTYLIGSISFAYIAGRMKGLDLRKEGSGTLGARNVKRVIGEKAASAVLLLDLVKGAGAVYLAGLISESAQASMTGWLGVICGHGWPIFLRFKGGKGLASSVGALLLISPFILASELALGGILLLSGRQVYLSASLMAASLPLFVYRFGKPETFVISIVISAVILILHRKNIMDLIEKWKGER